MFECEVRGVLATGGVAWSDREIAATIPGETSQILSCLDELLRKGVAHRNGEGAIHNRRMIHDENIRKIHAEAGKKGGNPLLVNQTANQNANQTTNQNPTPSSSTSSSTAKQKLKTNTPQAAFVLPDFIPRKSWDAWIEMRTKGRAKPTLRAMEMAVDRLVTLVASGSDAGQVLDQSTFNGWKGLFEVKQSPLTTGYASPRKDAYENKWDRVSREAAELLDQRPLADHG